MSNSTENTRKTVEKFFAEFGAGNVDGVLGLFADSIDFDINVAPGVPWGGSRRTRADMTDFFAIFGRELSAPEEYVVTNVIVDGAEAVAVGNNSFTALSTGRSFANKFALHFTVTDNQITGYHMLEDSFAVYEAFQTNAD